MGGAATAAEGGRGACGIFGEIQKDGSPRVGHGGSLTVVTLGIAETHCAFYRHVKLGLSPPAPSFTRGACPSTEYHPHIRPPNSSTSAPSGASSPTEITDPLLHLFLQARKTPDGLWRHPPFAPAPISTPATTRVSAPRPWRPLTTTVDAVASVDVVADVELSRD